MHSSPPSAIAWTAAHTHDKGALHAVVLTGIEERMYTSVGVQICHVLAYYWRSLLEVTDYIKPLDWVS